MDEIVLVRAYGDEPLKRIVVCKQNRLVYVVRDDLLDKVNNGESFPVGFPESDIYVYNTDSYEKIKNEPDSISRAEIWRSL